MQYKWILFSFSLQTYCSILDNPYIENERETHYIVFLGFPLLFQAPAKSKEVSKYMQCNVCNSNPITRFSLKSVYVGKHIQICLYLGVAQVFFQQLLSLKVINYSNFAGIRGYWYQMPHNPRCEINSVNVALSLCFISQSNAMSIKLTTRDCNE